MASTWTGKSLQGKFTTKSGFNTTEASLRVLEYINDIQTEIQSISAWPNLKMKIKKQIISGDQEIDISLQVPTAPAIAALAGGSIAASASLVKITFVMFDESGKEANSIESEPSPASNSVTLAAANLSLTITSIDLYDGSSTVKPTVIWRRIYLKSGTGDYLLIKTIEDNTTTTTTITAPTASTIEPPEYSLVSLLCGEDPIIEGSGLSLVQKALSDFLISDPNFTAAGLPQYYARTATDKIFLYPKPSATYTLSYWIYKVPCRIFADTERIIQLHHGLKECLEAGVTAKFYEYHDMDGQESKRANYETLKERVKGVVGRVGGQSGSVKVVC